MLLYLMFQYEAMGEQSSLFVANKLAYFLQRAGENLRLKFEAYHYGPYAVQLNHVLLHLNGVYLKGMEQNVIKPFEPIRLDYDKYAEIEKYIRVNLSLEQQQRLKSVLKLIQGFESTFSMELLSSVDYLVSKEAVKSTDEILKHLSRWNPRKTDLFQPRHVKIAYDHLKGRTQSSFELA